MSRRDVSGLWEPKPADDDANPDRSPGIAPPPRRTPTPSDAAPPPAVPPTPAAIGPSETLAPAPSVDAVPKVPQQAPKTTPPTNGGVDQSPVRKTGLSFTDTQLSWIQRQSDKKSLWLGEYFDELFSAHEEQVAARPVPRRRRSRGGSKYIPVQFYLDAAIRVRLDKLAETTGQSRSAAARAIVDAARNK